MFVVTVMFSIRPDAIDVFLPLMRAQAKTSVHLEPGCLQFDICRDPDRPNEVFLYEVYDDETSFQAHLDSPHFKAFDAQCAELVADKAVRTYRSRDQGGEQLTSA